MNCISEILSRLRESQRLCEMATINPQLCKNLGIQVEVEQRNEGPIPHLHVYLDTTRNPRNCAYIRLDKAEYSEHHKKKGKELNKEQKEKFLNIMSSIWGSQFIESSVTGDVKRATGYEAAVKTWIDTFGETVEFKYGDDGYPIMPDYDTI